MDGSLRFSKRHALLVDGVTRVADLGLLSVLTSSTLRAVQPSVSDYIKKPLAFSHLPTLLCGVALQRTMVDESVMRSVASEILTVDQKTAGSASPLLNTSVFSGITESAAVASRIKAPSLRQVGEDAGLNFLIRPWFFAAGGSSRLESDIAEKTRARELEAAESSARLVAQLSHSMGIEATTPDEIKNLVAMHKVMTRASAASAKGSQED